MVGDPSSGGGGSGHGSASGKGSRSSSRHWQFRDRAKTRVDDLQEMFSGLQSARKESRSVDATLLEEQVHQMLREWRAELSVASPASSLQGNNREASDPPSETLRLLQLAVDEEEDDATSRLVVPRSPLPMPPSHQSHRHGQDGQSLNPELQVQGEAVAGGATVSQQSLGQQMQGDCGGEVASAANAMFNDQEVPDGRKESPGGPWHFVGLMPLFDPPRHDSAETIRRALNLGVNVKMITGDQLAIGKEIGRRLGMGTNMYPSSALLGQNKDESIAALPVDLIEKADGFAGVFPGCYSPYPTEVS